MAFARHLARQLKIMFLNIRGFEFIVLLLRYIRWRLEGGFHRRNVRGDLVFGERGVRCRLYGNRRSRVTVRIPCRATEGVMWDGGLHNNHSRWGVTPRTPPSLSECCV